MEIAGIRHPIRDRRRAARGSVWLSCHLSLGAVQLVLLIHHADEHAYTAAQPLRTVFPQFFPRIPGIFQRLIHALKEQSLLRIGELCYLRRDAEEEGIELVHAIDETAPLAVGLARDPPALIEVNTMIPPLPRNLGDAVLAGLQVFPELLDVGRLWIATTQSDDRDIQPTLRRCLLRGLRSSTRL